MKQILSTLSILVICFLTYVNAQAQSNSIADDGIIVFVSDRDGNPEIYTMYSDGTNVIRLTDNDVTDGSPDWSPDGSEIVFRSDLDGDADIYIMNFDGSNIRQLTNNPSGDFAPRWSPTGSEILFISNGKGERTINIMDRDGGNMRRLGINFEVTSALWSSDGTQIGFASLGGNGVYTTDSDGSNVQLVVDGEQGRDYLEVTDWSPDGSQLALFTDLYGWFEVIIHDIDTSVTNRMTNNQFDDLGMSWSQDGSKVVFFSTRDNTLSEAEIYIADQNGRNPVQITNNSFQDYDPDWWIPSTSPSTTFDGTQPQVGTAAQVRSQDGRNINARSRPSTSGDIIASIPDGTIVTIIDDPTEADGYVWRRVILPDNQTAWMVERIGNFLVLNPIENGSG